MAWRALAVAAVVGVVAIAVPIARNEVACMDRRDPTLATYRPILPVAAHRNGVDSILSYPEWSIVHAYEDFAGVLRRASESDFNYGQSVVGYWRSLCAVSRLASQRGDVTFEMKAMLYIIGISFSAEMAVKGLWETTIGRLTVWLRGPERTREDRFALQVAEDYAAFLRQTPWFDYPFATTLLRFWQEPLNGDVSWVRSLERRFALSLEWGVKTVYARLIALLGAAAPAKLTIDTVVIGLSRDALAADRDVTVKGEVGGGVWVETPRYRAYTEFLKRVAAAGGSIREIAGNDRIFVTVIGTRPPTGSGFEQLVEAPLQAEPGRTRYGVMIPVAELTALIHRSAGEGFTFEHAYDY